MVCPNKRCRRQTDRLIAKADKNGTITNGCPACISRGAHDHVYTGRKVWTGTEVYGNKVHDMNLEWGSKLGQRPARRRAI